MLFVGRYIYKNLPYFKQLSSIPNPCPFVYEAFMDQVAKLVVGLEVDEYTMKLVKEVVALNNYYHSVGYTQNYSKTFLRRCQNLDCKITTVR